MEPKVKKYATANITHMSYFWKSRQNKDENGNNTCHLAFEIIDEKTRYKFLNLLLEEEIGDVAKANVMGLFPHELEHVQPLKIGSDSMPKNTKKHFATSLKEMEEADYLIVTPQDKKEIVIM